MSFQILSHIFKPRILTATGFVLKTSPRVFVVLLTGACLVCGSLSLAQKKKKDSLEPQQTSQPPIRVQVDLVNLHTTVFDQNGKIVSGLTKADFSVFEDNVQQDIALFGLETDTPVTVGILIDTSGSMANGKLEKAEEAAQLLAKTLSPKDEIFIMGFTDQFYPLVDFTPADTDFGRILGRLVAQGGTSVGAGVEEAILKMRDASNKKQAIVVISDGLDIPGGGVIDKIRSHEALVYAIGLKGVGGILGLASHIQAFNVHGSSLNVYANESGGKAIFVKTLDEVPKACQDIVTDLKGQYQIGYYPSNAARDGKYRRIKVLVHHPEFTIRYRRGYYAPRR
jgi:Ca-activated chloride channel homolog